MSALTNKKQELDSLLRQADTNSYHLLPFHFTFTFVYPDGHSYVRNPVPDGYPTDRVVSRIVQLVDSKYEIPPDEKEAPLCEDAKALPCQSDCSIEQMPINIRRDAITKDNFLTTIDTDDFDCDEDGFILPIRPGGV